MPIQNVSLNSLSFRGTNNIEKQSPKTQEEIKGGKTKLALALGALAVTGAVTAGIVHKTRKGAASEKDIQTIQNAAQNATGVLSSAVQKNETADLDTIKLEEAIAQIKEKSDAVLQEVKTISADASKAYDDAKAMREKTWRIFNSNNVWDAIALASEEGAKVEVNDIEFIAKKLDDGTGRTILTSTKDGISVLFGKDKSILTVKQGGDKIYIDRYDASAAAIFKNYSSEGGIKKADKMYSFYEVDGAPSICVFEGNAHCPAGQIEPTGDRSYIFRNNLNSNSLWLYNEKLDRDDETKAFRLFYDKGKLTRGTYQGRITASFDNEGHITNVTKYNIDYILQGGNRVKSE